MLSNDILLFVYLFFPFFFLHKTKLDNSVIQKEIICKTWGPSLTWAKRFTYLVLKIGKLFV